MRSIVIILSISLILVGCISDQADYSNTPSSSHADWRYHFVTWDGQTYEITNEQVLNIYEYLGEIERLSDNETDYSIGLNFSNKLPGWF